MKIYGKENDYYDSALAYGQDHICKWTRKFTEYKVGKYEDDIQFKLPSDIFANNYREKGKLERTNTHSISSRKAFNGLTAYEGYVFFCGKTYPVLKLKIGYKDEVSFYSLDSFEKYLISDSDYNAEDTLSRKRGFNTNLRKELTVFFSQNYDCSELHRINNIAVYTLFGGVLSEGGSLKQVDFVKVFDPYTCLQEIEMYLSGCLGGQSPKMVVTSDITRLEAKGFDKTISFRHRK